MERCFSGFLISLTFVHVLGFPDAKNISVIVARTYECLPPAKGSCECAVGM